MMAPKFEEEDEESDEDVEEEEEEEEGETDGDGATRETVLGVSIIFPRKGPHEPGEVDPNSTRVAPEVAVKLVRIKDHASVAVKGTELVVLTNPDDVMLCPKEMEHAGFAFIQKEIL
jgi:hypothetical protein